MADNGKISAIERKLKELDRESESLRGNIRDLARSLERSVRTGEPVRLPPRERVSAARQDPDAMEAADPAVEAPPAPRLKPEAPQQPVRAEEPEKNGAARAFNRNERFASYLASGSFGKARPLGREKRLQRNKAIFMLVTALLFAFIVIRVFFR